MFGLGTQELIIIFAILLLLFGAKRLPEVGRGLGQAIRSFKKSSEETEKAIMNETAEKKPSEEEEKTEEKKD
jgi:sec-independent protein translocase protein TatA